MSKNVRKSSVARRLFPLIAFLILLFDPVSAANIPDGFSFSSPMDLGLKAVYGYHNETPPVLDGFVAEGEYEGETVCKPGAGLVVSAEDGTEVSEEISGPFTAMEEVVHLNFDPSYFYVAIELSFSANGFSAYRHVSYGNVISVAVDLSAEDGENVAARHAGLRNVYYFSLSSPSPLAVSGTRLRYTSERFQSVTQISSTISSFKNCGYTDTDGEIWNGERYCREASLLCNEGMTRAVFECRIPVGDVLSCIDETKRAEVLTKMENGDFFCGSFLSQVSVGSLAGASCLTATTGIPTKSVCTFSDDGESWNEVLIRDFGLSKSTSYAIEWLMSPLVFGADDNMFSNPSFPDDDGKRELSENTHDAPSPSLAAPSTTANSGILTEEKTDPPIPETEDREEDESVFDGLPDEGDHIPESTEILPIENDEEGNETGLASSLILLLAGIFMLVSVIIVAFVFFKKEKEEKNNEKTKKSS